MLKTAEEMGPVPIKLAGGRNERSARTLDAVHELAPKIRAAADEIEQGRRLPLHIVDQMQRAGVFRMAMPRAWGGPELNVLSQIRVIEALSIADASAGWCAMIGADGGYLTAYIDRPWPARCMPTSIQSQQSHLLRLRRRQSQRWLPRQRTMAVREWMPACKVDDWPLHHL